MYHYVTPTIEHKNTPELVIIHCGTNNVTKNCDPEDIADEIFELAKSTAKKLDNSGVVVSAILPRKDIPKEITSKINSRLKGLCTNCNVGFIENRNFDLNSNIFRDKLHLNKSGASILARNFKQVFTN